MKPNLKHCHRLLMPAVLLWILATACPAETAVITAPVAQPLQPGTSIMVSVDTLAWLIHAPADGSAPVVVAVFSFGGDVPIPPPPPPPGKVAGVFIIEEQKDRTPAQGKVMDDLVWQTAAIVKGLTYAIEDKDGAQAKPLLPAVSESKLVLPVVCLIDSDGKPVSVVQLPATVEEMRTLIGGVK